MQNGFNAEFGVDSSSLHLLVNPLVMLEEKEEEEIRMKKEKRNSSILKSAIASDSDSIQEEFFKPKFRYVRHKKTKVMLKRIRF